MSLHITLFDDDNRTDLLPLSFSRSCADFRWGILTIKEKWELALGNKVQVKTIDYLQALYGQASNPLWVNSRLIPNSQLVQAISNLAFGESLESDNIVLAKHGENPSKTIQYEAPFDILSHPWELFQHNHREIVSDFERITKGRASQKLSDTNRVIGSHSVFLEEGAKAECVIFNTTEGPIYLAKDSEVQEGSMIRGPFSLGEHSQIKMGARIYSGTTVGPFCKVGGEVNNSVIFGYSNKGHEGFLGNSVLGEWCNLGADTNNSNLKNNYAEVKVWSYRHKRFVNTGLQFCGLIMGDHSKSGINTMFNTGTVVGFSANIFGSGFPRNIIPSFSWGGAAGMEEYGLKKALETAEKVVARRGITLSETDIAIFSHIFDLTKEHR